MLDFSNLNLIYQINYCTCRDVVHRFCKRLEACLKRLQCALIEGECSRKKLGKLKLKKLKQLKFRFHLISGINSESITESRTWISYRLPSEFNELFSDTSYTSIAIEDV